MTKIAVSSGDPAGIGPDICIKAFGQKKSLSYKPVIFGNIDLLKERADEIKIKVDIKEYSGEDSNSLTDESLFVISFFIVFINSLQATNSSLDKSK